MSTGGNAGGTALSPDEAFAVLGNETRLAILKTLGEADGPLSFSELFDRVEMRDSGQFNYHLDKLVGHFVSKTDDGYDLRQAGNRVVQAVLSGSITESPVVEPTEVDSPCIYCGAPTVVEFREERVYHYCTECSGTYGDVAVGPAASGEETGGRDGTGELGFLGRMTLPPAGIQGRTPGEVIETTFAWGTLEFLSMGRGICPRCAAPVERSVSVCEEHDVDDRMCERCEHRHAVICDASCTNCTHAVRSPFGLFFLANLDVLAFLSARGIDPLGDWSRLEWTEEIASTDPFEGLFTYTVGDDAIAVTVDDSLTVVDATETAGE